MEIGIRGGKTGAGEVHVGKETGMREVHVGWEKGISCGRGRSGEEGGDWEWESVD